MYTVFPYELFYWFISDNSEECIVIQPITWRVIKSGLVLGNLQHTICAAFSMSSGHRRVWRNLVPVSNVQNIQKKEERRNKYGGRDIILFYGGRITEIPG